MINQLFLIGEIKNMPVDDILILEVRRSYKNCDGIYEKDVFRCQLWMALSKKLSLVCKKGDLIAIKGRLVNQINDCMIIAEQAILLNKGVENLSEIKKI